MDTSGHSGWCNNKDRKQEENVSSGPPQDWCLHAQLTISHPKSEPIRTSYVATGFGAGGEPKANWTTTGSNVQFQYSWSNCDKETVTQVIPEPGVQKFESWPRSNIGGECSNAWHSPKTASSPCHVRPENLRSFSPPGRFSRNRKIQPYERRCISTCTITLTNEGFQQPHSKFSFSSESLNGVPCSSNNVPSLPSPTITRILVKDAETQTSPTKLVNECTSILVNPDTSNLAVLNNNKPVLLQQQQQQKQKLKGKESFNSVSAAKKGQSPTRMIDHSSRGSVRTSSAVRRAKSSPPIRYQQKTNQPRTVHIDVYCTGSEVSTSTEDCESSAGTASTPQTVYNTSDYKINHHHHKTGIPQHYGCKEGNNVSTKDKINGNIDTKTETVKNATLGILNNQILDVPTTTAPSFVTLRKNLSRESCDTNTTASAFSTTYPSSVDRLSRVSTASSSFSFASGGGLGFNADNMDTRTPNSIKQPDFDQLFQNKNMETSSDQWWLQYLFSKFELNDGGQENNNNNISVDAAPRGSNTNLLNMKRLSVPTFNLNETDQVLPPFMEHFPIAQSSRLDTASKFGSVVRGLKKPGHHIPGPTKNPNCPCDHCRAYFLEKDKSLQMGQDEFENEDDDDMA